MVKKLFYFLIPIILFTTNVYAETLSVTPFSKMNSYSFPNWWTVTSGGSNSNRNLTFRTDVFDGYVENTTKLRYGYLYVCSTGSFSISSPPSCTTGCLTGDFQVVSAGGTCQAGEVGAYLQGTNYFIFYSIDSYATSTGMKYFSDIITLSTTLSSVRIDFKQNTLTDEDYYITYASTNRISDLQEQTNNSLNSINSSINNQTNAINNQTNSINNQTNIINDDSLPNTSNFLDDWTDLLLENNTINQLLYLPVNVLTNIKAALNGTCTDYVMPFGITGGNETITFKCWTIQDYLGSELTLLLSSFVQFYLIYYFALFLWKFYDDFTSMKDTLSIILENPDGPLQKGEIS